MPSGRVEQFRNSLLQNGNNLASADSNDNRLAAAANGPSAAQDDSAAASSRTHTVKAGETLWNIARHYSLDVNQIKRWNGLQSSTLRLGQVLKLSAQG